MDAADDFSLYDDEEPAFPYRKKILAYPSGSKEAVTIYFLMEDLQNGKVIDARSMTGFPTLLRDGIVTPDGLLSEEVLEEIELYKEYHERRGREIRARRKRSPAEGVVTHLRLHPARGPRRRRPLPDGRHGRRGAADDLLDR